MLAPPYPVVRAEVDPYRSTAALAGWLFVMTFVTSIPAQLVLYGPLLDKSSYITGAGADAYNRVALGALLEVLLILANVGTAVVLFPILKRQSEAGALGYVAVRLVESTFIAIGIVSLLAILTVRDDGALGASAALGRSFVAIHDWTFLLGPGFIVGVGNGLLLGYLMYTLWLGAATHGHAGAHRRSPDLRIGDPRPLRRHRRRVAGSGHRDHPGVHLGAVARDLSHRQGIQAVSHPHR